MDRFGSNEPNVIIPLSVAKTFAVLPTPIFTPLAANEVLSLPVDTPACIVLVIYCLS